MSDLADGAARDALILRLKRIEGQLRGIQKMIEEGERCEAVAQQMSASRKALDKAFFYMVACAIEQADAAPEKEGGLEGRKRVAEMLARFA